MEVKSRIFKALRGRVVPLIMVLVLMLAINASAQAEVLDADADGVLHGDAVLFSTDLGGMGVLDSALKSAEGTFFEITNIYGSFEDSTNLMYKTGSDLGIEDDGTCSDDRGPNISGIAQLPDGRIIFTVKEDCNNFENKNIYIFPVAEGALLTTPYKLGSDLGITGKNSAIDALAVHPDDGRILFSTNSQGLGDRAGSAEDRATNIFVYDGVGSTTVHKTGEQLGVGSKKSTNIDALDVFVDDNNTLQYVFSTSNKSSGTEGSAINEDAPLKPSIIFISPGDVGEGSNEVYIAGKKLGIRLPGKRERPTNIDAFTLVHKADNCLAAGNPSQTDTDQDGIGNGCDNCPFVPNDDQVDTNGDFVGDACSEGTVVQLTAGGPNAIPDNDNDGLSNATEGSDPITDMNDSDSDGDGISDGPNKDRGGKNDIPFTGVTVAAGPDNCPNNPDPDQTNTDKYLAGGDDLGDLCDDDDDADGIPDDGSGSGSEVDDPCTGGNAVACDDNCPKTPNSNQADRDSDGIGDACDSDKDGDGATVAAGDCNDLDDQVKPVAFGGEEIPGNDIDDDCDDTTPDVASGPGALVVKFSSNPLNDWLPVDNRDFSENEGQVTVTATALEGATTLDPQPTQWDFELVDPMNDVSRIPGTHSNHVSADASPDFDISIFGADNTYTSIDGTITLTSLDYGGRIRLRVSATTTAGDVVAFLTIPIDSDDDGLPDRYEIDNGTDKTKEDTDGDGTLDGDEGSVAISSDLINFDALSMKEEYRGFIWGQLVDYTGSIGHMPDNPDTSENEADVYQTPKLVQGPIGHFRGKSNRRELFLKYTNFKGRPFAIGYCFQNIGIDGYAIAAEDISVDNEPGDANIDVLNVKMIDDDLPLLKLVEDVLVPITTYNGQDPEPTKEGERLYVFKTFGKASNQGNSFFYGDAEIFIETLDHYSNPISVVEGSSTRDKTYRDGGSFNAAAGGAGALGIIAAQANGQLDALDSPNIEDRNDSGALNGNEDMQILKNTLVDGDVVLPGNYSADLTAFDINDNLMIEAPIRPDMDPSAVLPEYEFSNEQIRSHIYTHEIGHAIGFTHNTLDELDVMYLYNNNWNRDGNLDGAGVIHNN